MKITSYGPGCDPEKVTWDVSGKGITAFICNTVVVVVVGGAVVLVVVTPTVVVVVTGGRVVVVVVGAIVVGGTVVVEVVVADIAEIGTSTSYSKVKLVNVYTPITVVNPENAGLDRSNVHGNRIESPSNPVKSNVAPY